MTLFSYQLWATTASFSTNILVKYIGCIKICISKSQIVIHIFVFLWLAVNNKFLLKQLLNKYYTWLSMWEFVCLRVCESVCGIRCYWRHRQDYTKDPYSDHFCFWQHSLSGFTPDPATLLPIPWFHADSSLVVAYHQIRWPSGGLGPLGCYTDWCSDDHSNNQLTQLTTSPPGEHISWVMLAF